MRILIVDDERQITRVLRTSLQSHGYDVQVAQDGLEAFTLFEQAPPDLIITDLAMPNMDGLELTRAVRRIAETPIIVLSVREQESTKIAALDSGADDYVIKPFSMPELMARVRSQLRRTRRKTSPLPLQFPRATLESTPTHIAFRYVARMFTSRPRSLISFSSLPRTPAAS